MEGQYTDHNASVGVESSCELEPPDMNAATLKLEALAAIVNDLIEQNGANPPWGPEAISLSRRLTEQPLDDLLQVFSQCIILMRPFHC